MHKLENFKNEDVSFFISEFGYGDCHMLSQHVSKTHTLDVGIIKSHPSGIPVHSFVYLNETYAFDAHGIDLIENTVERYRAFSQEYSEDEIRTERFEPEMACRELSLWCPMDQEDDQYIASELENIEKITGLMSKIKDLINLSVSLKPKNPQPI